MTTLLQASALQKAPTTASITTGASVVAGVKALNGVHTHSSSTGMAASHASLMKTSESESIVSTRTALAHENSSSNLSITQKTTRDSVSIILSEKQKRILQQETCALGDVLSQVPWMKFRLVAEPNMNIFASDHRVRAFVQEITELTVSIVTKQCKEEMQILVSKLMSSLTSSMELRVKLIMETVIDQIAALSLQETMTACQNLDEIKERACFPRHHNHHCDHDSDHHDTHDKHHHHHDTPDRHHHHDSHDKHHHPHDTNGDSDKYKHPDFSLDSADKHKRSNGHGEPEKQKPAHDNKPETPNKKHNGKLTPVPGGKSAF